MSPLLLPIHTTGLGSNRDRSGPGVVLVSPFSGGEAPFRSINYYGKFTIGRQEPVAHFATCQARGASARIKVKAAEFKSNFVLPCSNLKFLEWPRVIAAIFVFASLVIL